MPVDGSLPRPAAQCRHALSRPMTVELAALAMATQLACGAVFQLQHRLTVLVLLLVLLSSLLAPSTVVRSSTLLLACSPHSVPPSVGPGAPITAWVATLATQSASDVGRV